MDDVNPVEPPASLAGYERGGQADQLFPTLPQYCYYLFPAR